MVRLEWTYKLPTEIGWYWIRRVINKTVLVGIVEVKMDNNKLCVEPWGLPYNREWAGPIPEPRGKAVGGKDEPK